MVMLISSSVSAETLLSGTLIVADDGKALFAGRIVRDSMNVSMAVLNAARITEPKISQHVLIDLGGYVVEPTADGYLFHLSFPSTFDILDLRLVFPEGAEFKEVSSSVPYTHEGSVFNFNETNVVSPQIDIIYGTAKPKPVVEKISEQPSLIPYLLLAFSIVIAALILSVRTSKKHITVKSDILATLNDRERVVIDLLADSGGILSQARLRKRLDMPKSTLSNLVRDLEARKLVVRFENGSTYDVELEERVRGK